MARTHFSGKRKRAGTPRSGDTLVALGGVKVRARVIVGARVELGLVDALS